MPDDVPPPGSWALDLRDSDPPPLVQARRWAGAVLADVAEDHLSDVLLVTTELVTNAYDHGRGARELRMHHTASPCRVRIEVDDHNPEHPRVMPPGTAAVRGRGVLLVDRIAADWGVRAEPGWGGKTVWAEIDCGFTARSPCPPRR